ncbi:glucosyltransferase [Cladophialophora chaetospira]|uniref:Dol-P-Glc:Glc(2)Man(9)GlcNAc(2)-PP-Dol alpha-1,2-glucosyltransferase n=1 Tax=Cladophialophora chaetospira TaxID=386627 RepID=A0AA38X5D3_9EURO|nr:glucosyltransferase [Cladophialophora chaetospira]
MSYLVSPDFLRVVLLGFITSAHMTWRRLVNRIVPEPYLDEFFHVPQAQAYWFGKWTQWDPKITTPPGLYVYSYAVNSIRDFFSKEEIKPSIDEWRLTNVLLLYLLLVALYILAAVGRRSVQHESILQREFSIICFPLIFFFSGIYYTDLFSVFTVVVAQVFWSASTNAEGPVKLLYQSLHLVAGLASLAARQTNVFWVAVYLGGLQVVESIKSRVGADKVHDPPVSESYFEGSHDASLHTLFVHVHYLTTIIDFPITSISLAQAAVPLLPPLVLDLWPQLSLLVSFAAFVVWNGGVVLGDKDNHIATIHLPQMLYIWPAIIFFSWPVVLPLFSDLSILRKRLPRLTTMITFTAIMAAVVNLNTIIHPFTLADNRHYTFYVFAILRKHWLVKYAAVPVHVVCAALVIGSLGGTTDITSATQKGIRILHGDDTVCVSFVIVWLIATSLSLVAAPLVEPRYFLIPWLMWRLAVPEYRAPSAEKRKRLELEKKATASDRSPTNPASIVQSSLRTAAAYADWLELAWYMAVNAVTCYVFLYRGFEWPQEAGNVQRFMW